MGFTIAFVVPLPDEPEALTTGIWRLVFVLPALFAFIQLMLFLFVFKHETPLFLLKKQLAADKICDLPVLEEGVQQSDEENNTNQ